MTPLVNGIYLWTESFPTKGTSSTSRGRVPNRNLLESHPHVTDASRKKMPDHSKVVPFRPKLTVNRSFIQQFVDAEPPCFALGLVEEQNRQSGFLALRPEEAIPAEVTARGFSFGHSLLGTSVMEVIQFAFHFYGFHTYNVLVNPNNPVVQAVLDVMVEGGDYFFFALDPSNHVTAFRADIEQELLSGLTGNMSRIRNSTTTDRQYQKAVDQFSKNPEPEGAMVNWVCRDNVDGLDLTNDRLDLNPS